MNTAPQPETTPELLAKRWPAKRPLDECNFCHRPIAIGEPMAICPKKPWWWHARGNKWCNNYVHGSCADSNAQQSQALAAAPSVKPYAFAQQVMQPAPSKDSDLSALLRSIRDAIDTYLAEGSGEADHYANLESEIPF
jgi:hypothetical protein